MVFFFTLMILLVFVQVVLRFIFESGFSWGEEAARLLFVWMSFASFGYLTRGSRHVRMGFVRDQFPAPVQKAVLILCDILFLVFTAYGLNAMIQLCTNTIEQNLMLTAVPLSYNALYLAGLLGFLMMVLRNIQVLIWKFTHWNDTVERFINYDGKFYKYNKNCFEPKVPETLETAEAGTEELLEKGE